MPWRIERDHPACRSGEWAVVDEQADRDPRHSIEGCHPSREAALRQQRALYAKEPQMSASATQSYSVKSMVVPVQWRPVEWKGPGPDPGMLEGHVSVFDNIDQDGDVVVRGAFAKTLTDWASSRQPLPLVADHNLRTDGVIGSVHDAREDTIGVKFRARFASTQKAQDVRTLLREGHVNGFSYKYLPIRARPGVKDGQHVRFLEELRVFEFTVTPIPVNQLATATAVKASDTPWSSFTQADYTDEQWRRACLVDTGSGEGKQRYSLPVREPSGTLNRNAVHAAAARLNQVQAPADTRAAAARALVRLYGELDEEPPERLRRMAGTQAASLSFDQFADAMTKALSLPAAASKAAVDALLAAYDPQAAGAADEPPTADAAATTEPDGPAGDTANADAYPASATPAETEHKELRHRIDDATAYALRVINLEPRDGALVGTPPLARAGPLAPLEVAKALGDLDQLEAELKHAKEAT